MTCSSISSRKKTSSWELTLHLVLTRSTRHSRISTANHYTIQKPIRRIMRIQPSSVTGSSTAATPRPHPFSNSSSSSSSSSPPSSSSSASSSPTRYYPLSFRHRSTNAFANVTNYYSGMAATATATHHQYTTGGTSSSSSSSSREYYCQFCQRRFNKSYNLMIHERSHFEDSFVCDVCGKGGFRNRDLLRQHRSQHSPGGSSSSSTSSSSSIY